MDEPRQEVAKRVMPILMIHNVVGVVGVALDDLEVGRSKSTCLEKPGFPSGDKDYTLKGLRLRVFSALVLVPGFGPYVVAAGEVEGMRGI